MIMLYIILAPEFAPMPYMVSNGTAISIQWDLISCLNSSGQSASYRLNVRQLNGYFRDVIDSLGPLVNNYTFTNLPMDDNNQFGLTVTAWNQYGNVTSDELIFTQPTAPPMTSSETPTAVNDSILIPAVAGSVVAAVLIMLSTTIVIVLSVVW